MASIMTVRVPEELQYTLKQIAAKRGYTRNALILQILQKWLEDMKEVERSSMGLVISDMTKNDPLRKIGRFDYSSSIEEMLSCNASVKTKS